MDEATDVHNVEWMRDVCHVNFSVLITLYCPLYLLHFILICCVSYYTCNVCSEMTFVAHRAAALAMGRNSRNDV